MNRFVRAAAAAALAVGGVGSVGCVTTGKSGGCGAGGCDVPAKGDGAILRGLYDPCWPERYNAAARSEVLAPFAAQVNNGHVLNQTMWNWYFLPGAETLTPAGRAKLDSIAQTRPGPDSKLYIQAARDVLVTAENSDKIGGVRDDLTAKRAAAVLKYMATQPTIGEPVAYEIFVHDAVVPGISAEFATMAYRGQGQGYRGGIGGAAGSSAASTGGSGQTPAATAIGTGPGGGPNTGPSGPAPSGNGGAAPPGQ